VVCLLNYTVSCAETGLILIILNNGKISNFKVKRVELYYWICNTAIAA
jgi:hypothetical protein